MTLNNNDKVFEQMPGLSQSSMAPSKGTVDKPLTGTAKMNLSFTVASLTEVFVKLDSTTYSPSTTASFSYNIDPWKVIDANVPWLYKLHPYIRANVELQIRTTSQFQQVGALIAVLLQQPSDGASFGGSTITNLSTDLMTCFEHPHELIWWGEDSVVTINAKWNSVFNMLRKDQAFDQQSLILVVLDQMKVATGVTATSKVHIFWRLTDVQVCGYNNNI